MNMNDDRPTILEIDPKTGYAILDLHAAFNAVKNPENWKRRIVGLVSIRDIEITRRAAKFFAGSPLKVTYEEPAHFGPDRRALVEGPGYYACIGA